MEEERRESVVGAGCGSPVCWAGGLGDILGTRLRHLSQSTYHAEESLCSGLEGLGEDNEAGMLKERGLDPWIDSLAGPESPARSPSAEGEFWSSLEGGSKNMEYSQAEGMMGIDPVTTPGGLKYVETSSVRSTTVHSPPLDFEDCERACRSADLDWHLPGSQCLAGSGTGRRAEEEHFAVPSIKLERKRREMERSRERARECRKRHKGYVRQLEEEVTFLRSQLAQTRKDLEEYKTLHSLGEVDEAKRASEEFVRKLRQLLESKETAFINRTVGLYQNKIREACQQLADSYSSRILELVAPKRLRMYFSWTCGREGQCVSHPGLSASLAENKDFITSCRDKVSKLAGKFLRIRSKLHRQALRSSLEIDNRLHSGLDPLEVARRVLLVESSQLSSPVELILGGPGYGCANGRNKGCLSQGRSNEHGLAP